MGMRPRSARPGEEVGGALRGLGVADVVAGGQAGGGRGMLEVVEEGGGVEEVNGGDTEARH